MMEVSLLTIVINQCLQPLRVHGSRYAESSNAKGALPAAPAEGLGAQSGPPRPQRARTPGAAEGRGESGRGHSAIGYERERGGPYGRDCGGRGATWEGTQREGCEGDPGGPGLGKGARLCGGVGKGSRTGNGRGEECG